jgi:DNA repair protein RadC
MLELTRRYLDEQLRNEDIFTSPDKVMDYLAIQMRDNHREVFAVMLLDTRHRLIELLELFFGMINAASVHPREVAKVALEKNASAVIVAHNHPSGSAEPGRYPNYQKITGDTRHYRRKAFGPFCHWKR